MNLRTAALLFAVALATTSPLLATEPVEPCAKEIQGAFLMGKLEQISVTGSALRLLNGTEDARLRRLLSLQLATAAAEARRHVDGGVELAHHPLPHFVEAVKRASEYVSKNGLDPELLAMIANAEANTALGRRRIDQPAENLAAVSAWLAKHQAAAKR